MTRFVRTFTIFSLSILCSACANTPFNQTPTNPKIITPRARVDAPAFTLKQLRGGQLSLRDLEGQTVLIHFWATWCFSCREELPSLERISRKYKDKNLTVLSVCADRGNISGIKKAIKDAGVTFPTLLDADGTVRNKYEVRAFPTTYIIGSDGKFISKHVGAVDWESKTHDAHIKETIK